jgi:hypothetical protein
LAALALSALTTLLAALSGLLLLLARLLLAAALLLAWLVLAALLLAGILLVWIVHSFSFLVPPVRTTIVTPLGCSPLNSIPRSRTSGTWWCGHHSDEQLERESALLKHPNSTRRGGCGGRY